jgi:hypothetical protein
LQPSLTSFPPCASGKRPAHFAESPLAYWWHVVGCCCGVVVPWPALPPWCAPLIPSSLPQSKAKGLGEAGAEEEKERRKEQQSKSKGVILTRRTWIRLANRGGARRKKSLRFLPSSRKGWTAQGCGGLRSLFTWPGRCCEDGEDSLDGCSSPCSET